MPHVHYCGRLRLGGGNYLDPDALNFCRFSKWKNRAIFNVGDMTCHWRDSTPKSAPSGAAISSIKWAKQQTI
jgi:hypothetical protein